MLSPRYRIFLTWVLLFGVLFSIDQHGKAAAFIRQLFGAVLK